MDDKNLSIVWTPYTGTKSLNFYKAKRSRQTMAYLQKHLHFKHWSSNTFIETARGRGQVDYLKLWHTQCVTLTLARTIPKCPLFLLDFHSLRTDWETGIQTFCVTFSNADTHIVRDCKKSLCQKHEAASLASLEKEAHRVAYQVAYRVALMLNSIGFTVWWQWGQSEPFSGQHFLASPPARRIPSKHFCLHSVCPLCLNRVRGNTVSTCPDHVAMTGRY